MAHMPWIGSSRSLSSSISTTHLETRGSETHPSTATVWPLAGSSGCLATAKSPSGWGYYGLWKCVSPRPTMTTPKALFSNSPNELWLIRIYLSLRVLLIKWLTPSLPTQPLTLLQAAALTKLQEDNITYARQSLRPKASQGPISTPLLTAAPAQSTPPLLSSPKTTFKHLSPTEINVRCEKGPLLQLQWAVPSQPPVQVMLLLDHNRRGRWPTNLIQTLNGPNRPNPWVWRLWQDILGPS